MAEQMWRGPNWVMEPLRTDQAVFQAITDPDGVKGHLERLQVMIEQQAAMTGELVARLLAKGQLSVDDVHALLGADWKRC